MRLPRELSSKDLQTIVESVQQCLYLDHDRDDGFIWNPDKPWSGADVCDHVAHVLDEHGLVPDRVEPINTPIYKERETT